MNKIIHRASKLFQPIVAVQKNATIKQDVISKSQRLMLDLGVIRQASPGSFHYLPLGVKSLRKLMRIVAEEMNAIDAQEVIMPVLTNAKLWRASGRIDAADRELFKFEDRHNITYILSPTHEESAADLIASIGQISYKQFPYRLYQIGSKFRDEMKPRFGLMRSREFVMKDLYCFDVDPESAERSYRTVCESYDRIFERIGVEHVKVLGTTGNMGGSISHEYHVVAEMGEDKILQCTKCDYKSNIELSNKCQNCDSDASIRISNGIEVGHTFLLGDKYSKPLKATFLGRDGKPQTLQMGSYGLGLSRILAAAVEVLSLDQEIRWPEVLAPYSVVVIPSKEGSKEAKLTEGVAENLYHALNRIKPDDVLLDDRNHMTIGKRVLDAKRTGYPFVIVANARASYELIESHGNGEHLDEEQVLSRVLVYVICNWLRSRQRAKPILFLENLDMKSKWLRSRQRAKPIPFTTNLDIKSNWPRSRQRAKPIPITMKFDE